MPSTEGLLIEDGFVMGAVSTSIVGSERTFPICTPEEYEEMTEEEAEQALINSMWESGYADVYPKSKDSRR